MVGCALSSMSVGRRSLNLEIARSRRLLRKRTSAASRSILAAPPRSSPACFILLSALAYFLPAQAGAQDYDYTINSEPAGYVNQTGAGPAGTVVTTPTLQGEVLGRTFAYWRVNGVRQTDASGTALPAVRFTLSEPTTATAVYAQSDADTDGDGVPDWYELQQFGDLNQNAQSDPDGDGFTVAVEYARGYSARLAETVTDGGVASRMSPSIMFAAPVEPASIVFQPGGQSVLINGAITLSVTATGNPAPSYQWFKDGVKIAGATETMLSLNQVLATDAGSYTVVVSNSAGSVTSAPAVVTVTVPSVIAQTTAARQVVSPGEPFTLGITATGPGTLSYQWYHAGSAVAGATGPTLTIPSAAESTSAAWWAAVTDANGTHLSDPFFVLVAPSATAVRAWGRNDAGQTNVPAGLTHIVAISANIYHSLALKAGGSVVGWGNNDYAQTSTPPGLTDVVAVAAGGFHSLALKANGTVVGWGGENFDPLDVPTGLTSVVAIAAGRRHSLALKSDGTVVTWGSNDSGQLNMPADLTSVVAIAAGDYHSLALKSDGTVVAWGYNGFGQTDVPTNLASVIAVAGGAYHSLALKADGTVVAWGSNEFGQTTVPAGLSGIVAVSGGNHSLALRNDGTVVAWGADYYGQSSPPLDLSNVIALSAGYDDALALRDSTKDKATSAKHCAVLRLVIADWVPDQYSTESWERAVTIKATDDFQWYEATLWTGEHSSLHLYRFDETFDPNRFSTLSSADWIAYRESYCIYIGSVPPEAAADEKSAYLRDALIQCVRQMVADTPADHYGIRYSGHGTGTGGLMQGQVSPADARLFLADAVTQIGRKLDFIDLGGNCDEGTFRVLANLTPYCDYLVASDLPIGGYTLDDWTEEKWNETDIDYQLPLILTRGKSIAAALTDYLDLSRQRWVYSRNNMVAGHVLQSLSLYKSDEFSGLQTLVAPEAQARGLFNFSPYHNDLYTFIKTTGKPEIEQQFLALRVGYRSNKDFFDWPADFNGLTIFQFEDLSLTPATLTLLTPDVTYDGKPHAASATTDPAGLAVTITYNGSPTPPTAAGSYTVTATVTEAGYLGTATGTLALHKAPLTATATSTSRLYGAPNPTFAITYAGFVNGETAASITPPTASTTATVASPPGTYPITLSGGSAANYTLTLVPGTLTILARDYTGAYFGTFASGGHWALYVRADYTATYLAYLLGRQSAIVTSLTVSFDGSFTTSGAEIKNTAAASRVQALASPDSSRVQAAAAAVFLLNGHIADDGGITGTLAGWDETFTGSLDTGAAGTPALYTASALGTVVSSTYAIVGPSGQTFIVLTSATGADSATGSINASGQLLATTANNATLTLAVQNAQAVSATLTPPGSGPPITYIGQADAVMPHAWLSNLSVRAAITPAQTLIVGFVVEGDAKPILIRGAGPALEHFDVHGVTNPQLALYNGGTRVGENDDWVSSLAPLFATLGAFSFDTASKDAALEATLTGPHTAHATVTDAGTILVEAYDAGPSDDRKLVNLSARFHVGTDNDILIAGFVLAGTGTRQLLVRAIGPKLASYDVPGVLANPQLTLYDGGTAIAANDDWSTSLAPTFETLGAFALDPGSKDAALLVTLQAGKPYTVHVSGVNKTTGEALVELYLVP